MSGPVPHLKNWPDFAPADGGNLLQRPGVGAALQFWQRVEGLPFLQACQEMAEFFQLLRHQPEWRAEAEALKAIWEGKAVWQAMKFLDQMEPAAHINARQLPAPMAGEAWSAKAAVGETPAPMPAAVAPGAVVAKALDDPLAELFGGCDALADAFSRIEGVMDLGESYLEQIAAGEDGEPRLKAMSDTYRRLKRDVMPEMEEAVWSLRHTERKVRGAAVAAGVTALPVRGAL